MHFSRNTDDRQHYGNFTDTGGILSQIPSTMMAAVLNRIFVSAP